MSSSDGSTGSSVTAAFIAAAFRLDAMVATWCCATAHISREKITEMLVQQSLGPRAKESEPLRNATSSNAREGIEVRATMRLGTHLWLKR